MRMFSTPSSHKVGPVSSSDSVDHDLTPIPFWKRSLDIVCCLIALPVFLLCTLFAAILTWIASPGPIFFRQERVGYRGRRFNLYKFRTMHVSADTTTHQMHFAELVRSKQPMHKLDRRGDCRLIPGGWLLRASGLDELPQIINILLGDMSLVGPRPCIPYEYAQYSPAQRQRFATAPGLTGLWQVSGKNRTTFDEMIQFDIQYTQRRSLKLDLQIILLTPWAVWVQISDTRRAKKALNGKMQEIPAPDRSPSERERSTGTPSAQPWCADVP
jgi:exopolysaccharide production protein ExoY